MCPTSRHLWTTCFDGVECEDFEEDEDVRGDIQSTEYKIAGSV